MTRWCWQLACTHNVLADEAPANNEGNVYCPGCGHSYPIVDSWIYRDEEADVG